MKIFNKSIKIKATVAILLLLIVLIIITGIWFSNSPEAKTGAILGSLVAGLFVALIQFLIAWQDYSQTEKLKELELIEVLYNRDNRTFYENYIKKAKRKISMMGVTANRFFKDFADDSPNATSNAKVLISALERNVNVEILLPNKSYLDENKVNDFDTVKGQAEILSRKFAGKLTVKYFEHVPAHSIFRVDDECIVGPVFPELESKYTPALHLRNSSPIADKYLKYFENEWKNTK